jgi:predicted amidophosphoribosyltransferase
MKCPSCGAAVEEGADLCLECGEPMGDSPAARVARQENVIRQPPEAFAPPKTKKWPAEEPEARRCPGCGLKVRIARCPNCGTRLRSDEE